MAVYYRIKKRQEQVPTVWYIRVKKNKNKLRNVWKLK